MPDKKISQLDAIASVAGEDLFALVNDPAGTPATQKGTITQLAAFLDDLTETLTNKTINLAGNTLTGTKAEFDIALSDGNFAYASDITGFFDTAGTGLTSAGSTVNVIGTASRITANANDIDIASDYVGQTSITTLGTIGTGTWQGDVVASAFLDADTMHLSVAQTVNGAKTFLDTNLFLRNVANTFNASFVNTNTADRIYTLPDTAGTIALTSDLTGFITATSTDTLQNKTIGHEDFTNDVHADVVHVQVRNESGGAIARGDAVYVSGYSIGQDLPLVSLADASNIATMPAFGIVEDASIANNSNGSVYISGRLEGMNTVGFSAGDILYVSNVGTTGNTLTATKPTGTDIIESVGEVLRSHASLGRLEIELTGIEGLPNLANTKVWIGDASGVPQEFALSGDVSMTAGGAVTIGTDAVTYAKMQNVVADNVFLGNNSGAGSIVDELTATEATAMLNVFTSGLKGLAPLSGGGTTNFLRADGTWAAPAGHNHEAEKRCQYV
jgi:hypothetical protein